jgi:ferredoxin
MKVAVDRERCVGSGMCTSIAPTVFALDSRRSLVISHDEVVSEAERAAVRDAVACCPAEALSVEE